MPTIIVPLKDFVIDPEHPVDLTQFSTSEAIERVKQSFDFLSTVVDVKLYDGILTITLPEEKGQRAAEAVEWFEHGNRLAQRAEYKRAINLFEKTLKRLPNHVDARRNLAMAHLESGDPDTALDLLVQVLKINPKDTWSYVLLGNIYAKNKNDFDRAIKCYERAIAINPDDAILLTNYGAIMLERGQDEQAAEFFERAIAANRKYPNSYYALAQLDLKQRKNAAALQALDNLFDNAMPMDMRSDPLYKEARNLYTELAGSVAQSNYDHYMQLIEAHRELVAAETGSPIQFIPDDSLPIVKAVTQTVWKHGTDEHRIRYRPLGRAFVPYILAHELTHLRMENAARQIGRNRNFATTPETRERMIRSISDDVFKLRKLGYPEQDITHVTLEWVNGMANQLFNMPLDIVIEARLFEEMPELRPSQFSTLNGFATENALALTDPKAKQLSPARIYRGNIALSGAYAMLMDALYPGRADFAAPYRKWEHFNLVKQLYNVWEDLRRDWEPGDEYDLVDEFARILKFQDAYEWQPDEVVARHTDLKTIAKQAEERKLSSAPQGATNPELLKQKEPATVMYLLGTLERFEHMTDEEIRAVAVEVGIKGMEGLDYSSPEPKYTLNAFPGETFSGLQLMAFMYVGFKRIDPTLDTSIDFDDAYQTALQLYQAKKD